MNSSLNSTAAQTPVISRKMPKLRQSSATFDQSDPRRRCSSELKNYTIVPNATLQKKMDYFITPYNKTIHLDKHMDFGDFKTLINSEQTKKCFGRNKWSKLMDFITKSERKSFRHSLNSINNGLYLEMNNMVKHEVNKRMKKIEFKKEIQKLNFHPRASVLVTQSFSGSPGVIPDASMILNQLANRNKGKKKLSTIKKKDIFVNSGKAKGSEITTSLLSVVNDDKFSLMVEELRKIMEEEESSEDDQKLYIFSPSPIAKEIKDLKQRRSINMKKLQANVQSPEFINQTKRVEAFFKDALSRKRYTDAHKHHRSIFSGNKTLTKYVETKPASYDDSTCSAFQVNKSGAGEELRQKRNRNSRLHTSMDVPFQEQVFMTMSKIDQTKRTNKNKVLLNML
uniref:Uncharacterized protein n=1 Tax=Euplotes harpa TaxID=151035 RepID=A0A7S3NBJ8_9SPIT|mmetsp:Transcript_33586/g.38616  ORF Transcript_33586/g.38616 Transcript_33586/m.38616 type:complete len:396 (+) Transcript_33586:153-1340(+)